MEYQEIQSFLELPVDTTLDKQEIDAFAQNFFEEIYKKGDEKKAKVQDKNPMPQLFSKKKDAELCITKKRKETKLPRTSKKQKSGSTYVSCIDTEDYFGICTKICSPSLQIKLKCTECLKTFDNKSKLFEHLQVNHRTKSPHRLYEILKQDEASIFECIIADCSRYFDQKSKRNAHIRSHFSLKK